MKYLFLLLFFFSLNTNALDPQQAAQLLTQTKAFLKKANYDDKIINDLKKIVVNKDGLPIQAKGDNFVCAYTVICEKNPYDLSQLPTYYTYKKDILCVMFAPGESVLSDIRCLPRSTQ